MFLVLVSLFEKPTQIARILYKAHRSDELYHSVEEVPPNQRKTGLCWRLLLCGVRSVSVYPCRIPG